MVDRIWEEAFRCTRPPLEQPYCARLLDGWRGGLLNENKEEAEGTMLVEKVEGGRVEDDT